MVILVVIILVSFLITPIYPTGYVNAETNQTYYARVMTDNCKLYKTATQSDEFDNCYFVIPKTYFVILTGEEADFFEVKYANFTGYVKKENLRAVLDMPQTPYLLDACFRVFSEQSQSIREKPTSTSKQTYFIPLYSRNVKFFGTIEGEQLISERTNIWYYCCFVDNESEYYGYVYSDFCDKQVNFVDNLESVNYTDFPDFSAPTLTVSPAQKFNKKATCIVVAVLCVPALIFVFLFVKGGKLVTKEKTKSKEVQDY